MHMYIKGSCDFRVRHAMGFTLFGVLGGFALWMFLDWKYPVRTERAALAVCLLCVGSGLAIGLWADADTLRAIASAMHRGPVPKY